MRRQKYKFTGNMSRDISQYSIKIIPNEINIKSDKSDPWEPKLYQSCIDVNGKQIVSLSNKKIDCEDKISV